MICEAHGRMETLVETIHKDVAEMKGAVLGTYSGGGMVERLHEVETEIGELKSIKSSINRIVWRFAIAVALGGGGVTAALKILL